MLNYYGGKKGSGGGFCASISCMGWCGYRLLATLPIRGSSAAFCLLNFSQLSKPRAELSETLTISHATATPHSHYFTS